MRLARLVGDILGDTGQLRIECYDGSTYGPRDATCVVQVRSSDAFRYVAQSPGELGFARAYVSGSVELEGDILAGLSSIDVNDLDLGPIRLAKVAREVGRDVFSRLEPPPEEIQLSGKRHDRDRDAAAVAAHYDLPNGFYELLLGDSMTYSCAVFEERGASLDAAQDRKHQLVCDKLALRDGSRLLDVGCGWGSMAIHAARHYGAHVVGVTLSREQLELGRRRVQDAGLGDLVELRYQDYRDIEDEPFDAISSLGLAEHVGWDRLDGYASQLHRLVRPGGRVLNHQISNWTTRRPRRAQDGFIQRYVFPDGELYGPSVTVAAFQDADLEVRHVESLREHYAITLRHWLQRLEASWDDAVGRIGLGRARVWRLYIAAAAVNFERGHSSVHQTLAVRPTEGGASLMPLRPDW